MCTKDRSTDHTILKSNRADNSSTMFSADILHFVSAWTVSKIPMSLASVSKNVSITSSSFLTQSSFKSQAQLLLSSKSRWWSPKAKQLLWLGFPLMKLFSNPNTKSKTKNSLNWLICPWKRRIKRRNKRKQSKNPKSRKLKKNEKQTQSKIYMLLFVTIYLISFHFYSFIFLVL